MVRSSYFRLIFGLYLRIEILPLIIKKVNHEKFYHPRNDKPDNLYC